MASETTNYNTDNLVFGGDNLLDSLEVSSEESFQPITWQVY